MQHDRAAGICQNLYRFVYEPSAYRDTWDNNSRVI